MGRDNWLTFIEDDLNNYIAEGGAKVRFLHGDYGDGKTHLRDVPTHKLKGADLRAYDKGAVIILLTRDTKA